jgi:PrtD family type I secretion system ABC transporter
LRACRMAFVGIGLMSLVINLLYLTGSIFMLEVYDRVLPSRSVPTLVGLCVLAGGLFVAQGALDFIRVQVLARIGSGIDEAIDSRVFRIVMQLPLMVQGREVGLQPIHDVENVRGFLSGLGPTAFFDLPWLPLYLGICFLFHPLIGLTALVGAILLAVLTIITEVLARKPALQASRLAAKRLEFASAGRRNAEVLMAMGMTQRLGDRWAEYNRTYREAQLASSDIGGGISAIARVMRMMLQAAVLAVGAWLVINQQATAGVIIAASIISARALAPVDLAIAHWKGFVTARQSYSRLNRMLGSIPEPEVQTGLPKPERHLKVESLSVVPPGSQKVVLQDVSLTLNAGSGLGVIGPSGSGKSSLVRALVGVWRPARGHVRLDGATLDQWSSEDLGRHVGYLPQDVELFAGTVAQNIARFDPEATDEAIVAAAIEAGAHDLIVKMPGGYNTSIGEQGSSLSAGQAQRIAVARALYGAPFLVVLDEPNSNLDTEGDNALTKAVQSVRARGGIVVVVAHRPVGIEAVDQILMLREGRLTAFGPKEEVLGQVLQKLSPAPIKIVSDKGSAT